MRWQPSEGPAGASPGLIVPDTSAGVPDWAEWVVTREASGRDAVELVSDGTWFFPRDAPDSDRVVRSPQPGNTGAVQMIEVGDGIAVWHDAGGWANNPANAWPALQYARAEATEARMLWAPALGTPADYAVWAYLGIDLFDASPLLVAAVRGIGLTTDGPVPAKELERIHGGTFDRARLTEFNLQAARAELERIRLAIDEGRLRGLAERRAYASPDMVAMLRRADRDHGYLERSTPVRKAVEVPCMTSESLWMPEVRRYRRRLRDDYRPPAGADVLVVLPCSARKPYRLSKTHRYFARALDDSGIRHRVHEVMVTSPLGMVPRELEDVYPAGNYDVPVTGHWSRDEEEVIRRQLAHLLMSGKYRHVIMHVGESTHTFLRDLLPDGALHTAKGRPSSKDDCDRLRDALRRIQKEDKQPFDRSMWNKRKLADIAALASFQFGPEAADALVEGTHAHGKTPYVKVADGAGQVAMVTDKSLLSLTLRGAGRIAAAGAKRVHIEDFWPRKTGSLFAVGVESADPDIRPGDDVVVVCGDEVRACGQAMMSAQEMTDLKRGVAVQLRHVATAPVPAADAAALEVEA